MSLTILTHEITSEERYPFRTPNPADTVDTIVQGLNEIENQIDSPEVDSEVTTLDSGGLFFGKNTRPCLNIKLRTTKTPLLKKFGCAILPVSFGNLVYLVKYEYLSIDFFKTKEEQLYTIKKKLNTIDKWMEYTFIQTLGDYIYVEMLKKFDPDFNNNLPAFKTFLTME
jgi:hypothetical protein